MTTQIDVERALDVFLAPERDELPDRVLEAALAEIARTPQRRVLRVPLLEAPMTVSVRFLAAAAAALVLALGAIAVLSSRTSTVGPQVSPSPTAGPSASPSPTAAASPTLDPVTSTYFAMLERSSSPLNGDGTQLLGCIQQPTKENCASILPADEGYLQAAITAYSSATVPAAFAAANQTLIADTRLVLADELALGRALDGGSQAAIAAAVNTFTTDQNEKAVPVLCSIDPNLHPPC